MILRQNIFYDLGYNLRPTEITGYLGSLQLKEIRKIIDAREKTLKFFKIFKKKNEIVKIKVDHIEKLSSFAIPMVFKI